MLKFAVLPWNFKSNPVMFAKASTFTDYEWDSLLKEMKRNAGVVLATCNRTEVYFSVDETELGSLKERFPEVLIGEDAVRHVFRVASGLESMSIGENEILGQLSEAFEKTLKRKMSDKLISLILRKAIATGKKIRKETEISKGRTSISAIAVERAERVMDLKNSTITVVGTGKMAEQFLKYLVKYGPKGLSVVGRNSERLSFLQHEYRASPHYFDELSGIVSSSDIIFVATSSKNIIIHKSAIDKSRKTKQIFIDISHPRNVDHDISGIHGREIVSLDDITMEISENLSKKEREIGKAEKIINESVCSLEARLKEMQVEQLIEKSYRHIEGIARSEIDRMLIELRKGNDPEAVKDAMVRSMIEKILSSYIQILKKAADNGDEETLKKFELSFTL